MFKKYFLISFIAIIVSCDFFNLYDYEATFKLNKIGTGTYNGNYTLALYKGDATIINSGTMYNSWSDDPNGDFVITDWHLFDRVYFNSNNSSVSISIDKAYGTDYTLLIFEGDGNFTSETKLLALKKITLDFNNQNPIYVDYMSDNSQSTTQTFSFSVTTSSATISWSDINLSYIESRELIIRDAHEGSYSQSFNINDYNNSITINGLESGYSYNVGIITVDSIGNISSVYELVTTDFNFWITIRESNGFSNNLNS